VHADGLRRAPGRAHVIVANIVADVVIPLLSEARAHLEPGGVCVGSGLVANRVSDVLCAGRAAGLCHLGTLAEGEWRAVMFQAPGPSPKGHGGRGRVSRRNAAKRPASATHRGVTHA
jgi:ribosomal protein L11 methyltransferase